MKKFKKRVSDPFDSVLSEAIENPAKRYHFYKTFLELEVLTIGTVSTDETDGAPILHLKYIEVDNELVLPVYSSQEKFESIYRSKYKYVKIMASQLLQLVELDKPWVLNPGFDISKKIIPEELETLRDGRILHYYFNELPSEDKQQLLTDQMTEIPDTLINSLSDILRTFPSIKKAYLTNVFNPSNHSQPIPILGLEADSDDREELNKLVSSVFEGANQISNQHIEIVILTEDLPLYHSIVDSNKPFYIRKSIDDLRSMFR